MSGPTSIWPRKMLMVLEQHNSNLYALSLALLVASSAHLHHCKVFSHDALELNSFAMRSQHVRGPTSRFCPARGFNGYFTAISENDAPVSIRRFLRRTNQKNQKIVQYNAFVVPVVSDIRNMCICHRNSLPDGCATRPSSSSSTLSTPSTPPRPLRHHSRSFFSLTAAARQTHRPRRSSGLMRRPVSSGRLESGGRSLLL